MPVFAIRDHEEEWYTGDAGAGEALTRSREPGQVPLQPVEGRCAGEEGLVFFAAKGVVVPPIAVRFF
jgi:hypothetical protein